VIDYVTTITTLSIIFSQIEKRNINPLYCENHNGHISQIYEGNVRRSGKMDRRTAREEEEMGRCSEGHYVS
jgi:hypothetical protein